MVELKIFVSICLSGIWLFATQWTIVLGILQARILEWVAFTLLQGIVPTQGSNPGLPRCRQILYQLSHQGSPRILEWVAYSFSSKSSRPRNWTCVSCTAGGFFTNWAIREAVSDGVVLNSSFTVYGWPEQLVSLCYIQFFISEMGITVPFLQEVILWGKAEAYGYFAKFTKFCISRQRGAASFFVTSSIWLRGILIWL